MGEKAQKNQANPKLPQRLRELGINTGMTGPDNNPAFYTTNGFGYYVENIVNKGLCLKFSSSVTNWSDFVNKWMVSRDPAALTRDYALEDPQWLSSMSGRLSKAARLHAPNKPCLYDLRDELSTTISANPFDYDFSPTSLAAFHVWLKTRYASLDALNKQWETQFAQWDEVIPFTTDQIKQRMATGEAMPKGKIDWAALRAIRFDPTTAAKERTRWNLAPWADHRTYMDTALSSVLGHFRQVAHKEDPATPVGVEGTQMPSAFGGYDLWRLSQVLDWIEPYDICNAREIFGSFMPGKPILATVFEKETRAAERRLWHLLLEGDKGCIIWWSEDVIDWSKIDLPLTAKGQALAPVLDSLNSPLARLFMLAERERDPIAIHYSHPSIQVAWMIESIADGATWPRRFSSYEADHNRHAVLRNAWLKAFQDQGFSPVFISSAEIENGALEKRDIRILALPGSSALSDQEVTAITTFAKVPEHALCGHQGAGIFDEHGTLRAATQIAAIFAGTGDEKIENYVRDRLHAEASSNEADITSAILKAADLTATVKIPSSAKVRVHRFKVGDKARLLAFERNIEYKMREELAQAGGNDVLEKPITFKASLDTPAYVINLQTGEKLGHTNEIEVKLDPWRPSSFALLPDAPQGEVVAELLRVLPTRQ